ncbi:MAG: aminotransferase class III-fold pyridoxal phosphate-dependent enzyme [Elusimicrobia bacterium]|nr:aminotransferase class III-fold pyridoxal phosphate-dependent enzyme [Elusimicrobiota bacterium]
MSPASAYRYPESSVFYRKLNRTFPKIVRGEGCWLFDDSGKKYLDACGGAFVANLGHGAAEIADAVAEQLRKVAYVNGTAFTHDAAEELAAEVTRRCPGLLNKAYFLCSGSEAVEAALKLARQYWAEIGRPAKRKILATAPGYHGNTLLALSASARGHTKKYFDGWLVDVPTIPAPYSYRCPCSPIARMDRASGERPAPGSCSGDCPACSGSALEEAILKEGPETVAAFIVEPIGGSSTGASVPRNDYHKRIREICDRHSVLFIADEVLTGAGRTGTWLALGHYGVAPDIVIMGKGLSGGYAPLSAVVAPRRLLDPIAEASGALAHAQTFSHTPAICAAGLAAIRAMDRRQLIPRVQKMGELLHRKLKTLLELPGVGDARGLGLLAGIELVRDKTTREPFPRSLKIAETLVETAQELGLVLWPNIGHADGTNGDLVMVAPPFVISEAEIEELVSRLRKSIEITIQPTVTNHPRAERQ